MNKKTRSLLSTHQHGVGLIATMTVRRVARIVALPIVIGLSLAIVGTVSAASQGLMPSGQPALVPTGAVGVVSEQIVFGMGCFWGAEKRMAEAPGVINVISGYAGGERPNPSYRQILADEQRATLRNHTEVVQVIFDPAQTSLEHILAAFWEHHDPTQGDRQGNDVGSNYRSAIYYNSPEQEAAARLSLARYQDALRAAGYGAITTEIAPLAAFFPAEEEHQDYLLKNPNGYCGLGGTGVAYPWRDGSRPSREAPLIQPTQQQPGSQAGPQPGPQPGSQIPPSASVTLAPELSALAASEQTRAAQPEGLSSERQLIVYEADGCGFCALFEREVLASWMSPVPVHRTLNGDLPTGWELSEPIWATPTIVLFEQGRESARYTGYNAEAADFWYWLARHTLSEDAFEIAYGRATEAPYTGALLDNRRSGTYVDPVTGTPLFRSDSKFKSGTGWPSFFQPIDGAVTMHEDLSHGMRRTEVRSASSGIHLGHVFEDGPPPTGKRYCINSRVLSFIPDQPL